MAQSKKKEEQKKPRKKNSLAILNDRPLPEDGEVGELEPSSIWKEEVDGLLGQKFNSILEVIDAIAERVCIRLGQENDSNLHEFIVMMLDTDEEIREELIEVFEIKQG